MNPKLFTSFIIYFDTLSMIIYSEILLHDYSQNFPPGFILLYYFICWQF